MRTSWCLAIAVAVLAVGLNPLRISAEPKPAGDPTEVPAAPGPISAPKKPAAEPSPPVASKPVAATELPAEHPLKPVLQMAENGYEFMDKHVADYTCLLTKRERVGGRLRDYETIHLKLRHARRDGEQVLDPFGVYLRFVSPDKLNGREILFVEGENYGKFIVRNGGPKFGYITTALPPDSPAVMRESRYPITEIGIKNLLVKLIEIGNQEMQRDECEVKILAGAKVNRRPCTLVQVSHPERRDYFRYYAARIFVDDEWRIPVRFAAYDWPEKPSEAPPLLEEYTYTDLKFNVGLSAVDFSHRNEEYGFRKDFEVAPATAKREGGP